MSPEHTLWLPAWLRPKRDKGGRPRSRRLSQPRLALKLREDIDAAMTLDRAAYRRLRRTLNDYPDALSRSHIVHQLGKRRMAWLTQVFEEHDG